ncbi:MAG: methyltransferase domain-containing protein [Planctomycetes bacterium]|nr:methyltransferase domain-containing protein [Planctomycetota bacterium]
MIQKLRETAVFFREFCGRFQTTGSIVPSSRFLAKRITRQLAERGPEPIRVLECGAGTGAFTGQIIEYLRPQDRFDLVEMNDSFVRTLERRFATEPRWQPAQGISQIHQLPLQEFQPAEPYDYIISGLPHINFPVQLVQEILDCYTRLLKPQGKMSYFEYMYIRPIRKMVTFGQERRRVHDVDAAMKAFLQQHRVTRDSILLNFPPAWVQHIR